MAENINYLCEIGTEEIPAGYIPPAVNAAREFMEKTLKQERLSFTEIYVYATPRRLAILVSDMADIQSADEEEIKGPSLKAAYDENGNPAKPLQGFMQGNNVKIDDIYTRDTGKGEYIFAKRTREALPATDIIPGIIEKMLGALPFPKRMRWGDKKIAFPRPISYFCVLLNNSIIQHQIEGIPFGNNVRGHYIQNNVMVEITDTSRYIETLNTHGVIVEQERRKQIIRQQLEDAAASIDGVLIEDEELLDTVTFLTEWPYVVVCDFDTDFLQIPDIVLITEMKEHQKYFAVNTTSGGLMPKFLVISNNPPNDNVKQGNERVITARFSDARFFFGEDRKTSLAEKVDQLKDVLFHKDLGSIYDKVERMMTIADEASGILDLPVETREKIDRAVMLSKADLNTSMVFEFTSLQGEMGKIYAILDGEDREVAAAIDEHYRPRSQGDEFPVSMVSIIVSLAEKVDNLFGSFSVGNIPKGSQDPYALRRQAAAIVEMLIQNQLHLSLDQLFDRIASQYRSGEDLGKTILDFINTRAKTYYTQQGFSYDEINACLAVGIYDYYELQRRAESVHDFRKDERFGEMLLAFKRMNNIVSAFQKKNPGYSLHFDPALLKEKEEKDLYDFFNKRKKDLEKYLETNDYQKLFMLLIEGKSVVDYFFDKVMVMVDDTRLRDNRLGLLDSILENFNNLIDFSEISE